MTPLLTADDVTDLDFSHSEGSSKRGLSHAAESKQATYFQHLFGGEFGSPRPFSLRCGSRMASLGCHVPHVVDLGSQEQMVWIDAERVVAAVENAQPTRYRTAYMEPRHSMCPEKSWLVSGNVDDYAVSFGINISGPSPTSRAGTLNLFPEDFRMKAGAFTGPVHS